MNIAIRIGVLTLGVPFLAAAAPATYDELIYYIISLMNYTVGTLVILGLVFYFYGVARNMLKAKEGDATASRKFLLMGIAVLFVMVSVWGILELLRTTLFEEGASGVGGGGDTAGFCDSFNDPNCTL